MYRKNLSFSDCEIKLEGDNGKFRGYASVFGGVDSYGDTILRGAYESTLRSNGKPKMFFNHDSYSLPIGKWIKASEDEHGLLVEGELTIGNNQSENVLAALKHGTLDGLSIGYYLKKGDYEETDTTRIIKKVSHLVEVSVVTFPADGAARVDLASVKSEELEQIETIREFERFLRDAGGLSKGLTEALISRAKIVFARGEPGAEKVEAKAMNELMQRLGSIQARIPQ